jgi:DNA modification methylase
VESVALTEAEIEEFRLVDMRNQILHGDVLEMLKTLLAESVNCIITSPPYFGLRDYDLPQTHWPEVSYAPMAGLPPITIPPMSCCFGLEDTIEAYVGHMVLVFRESWRVLRGDGVGWLNLGDSYAGGNQTGGKGKETLGGSIEYQRQTMHNHKRQTGLPPKNLIGIPWRIAFALQADGWYLRSDVIWHKINPMPESVRDRPTKAHEYVFLLAKSERYWWDQEAIREPNSENSHNGLTPNQHKKWAINGASQKTTLGTQHQGRNRRTVWSLSSQSFPGAHFAVMPEALVEPCLLAGCPAQVCAECGEPWVRLVEKSKSNWDERKKNGATGGTMTKGANTTHGKGTNHTLGLREIKTVAHTPTCQCCPLPAVSIDEFGHQWPIYNATRPGVTLDPFFGSGTVGVVAEKLKRNWLGIELNPDYIELAKDRIYQTQPALFAR